LASCEQRLGGANADCQKRLVDQKKQLYEQARARYDQLSVELTRAQGDAQKWEKQYGQLKGDLTRALNDFQKLQTQYAQLNPKLVESERTVAELRDQNLRQKASYEKRLADSQSSIDARTREIADKNREITRLTAANGGLTAEVSKLGVSLKSSEQAAETADRARTELQKKLADEGGQKKNEPTEIFPAVKEAQAKMDQEGAPAAVTTGQNGSLKRELVIGTLEIKPYPTEVPADGKLQLVALFTPHPLKGAFGDTPWYVKLVYNPPPGVNAPYDQKQSLGDEDRKVVTGNEHKWVWIVDLPKNAPSDLIASQIDILAGFEFDSVMRIAGQSVVLTREKSAPGFFARVMATIKENLTYILMTITALCGIWAGILTVKIKKFELNKSEKENLTKGRAARKISDGNRTRRN